MYLQGFTCACELQDDLKSYQAWSELFCTRKCCESYQIHTSCSVVPALSTEIRRKRDRAHYQIKLIKLFNYYSFFLMPFHGRWRRNEMQRRSRGCVWTGCGPTGCWLGLDCFPALPLCSSVLGQQVVAVRNREKTTTALDRWPAAILLYHT